MRRTRHLSDAGSRTSFRRLGRDAALYSIGVLLGRAVSFIMLPVYTRYLSPADYGLISLLDLAVDITAILFTAGTTAGVQRFYFKTNDPLERNRILSTAFLLMLGLASSGAIALSIASPAIWRYGLKGAGASWFIIIAAANFALGVLVSMPQAVAQTKQKAHFFVGISLLKLVLQLSFNIFFIVHLQVGPVGLLWSTFLTYVILGGFLAAWLLRQTGVHFDMRVVRELRRFGVPYQVTWAGSFLLTFGDRFFLQAGPGIATVGIYGMAYQFGFLLQQLGSTPFLNAWNPHRHQLVPLPRAERDARYNRGFLYFNLLLITVATGMAVFIRPVLMVMTTEPYHGAARLVPIILLAYVAEAWMEVFRFGIDVSEKTKYAPYATWITVAVVLVLYALLIPRYGAMGAAVATVLGFTLRASLVFRWARRLWPISWSFDRPLRLLALGVAAAITAWFVTPTSLLMQVGAGIGIMLVYAAVAWRLVLGPNERAILAKFVRSPAEAWAFATRES